MADLSDVAAYLVAQSSAAVYPNGIAQPSVAVMDVRVFRGWPIPDQLDLDVGGFVLAGNPAIKTPRVGGPIANVSVFPMRGATSEPFQLLNHTYTIVPPVFGLSINITGPVVTVDGGGTVINLSGTPSPGEYVTAICDGQFVYSATGASLGAILAALQTQALVNYPLTTTTASSITIPVNAYLVVRQGAPATLGRVTHRQKHSIMITVWAPNHAVRDTLAAAIDVLLKKTTVAAMPDTSQAKICYDRTNESDEQQLQTVYRRDLIFDVEYATLEQFIGYVVTSFSVGIAGGNWSITTQTPPTVTKIN